MDFDPLSLFTPSSANSGDLILQESFEPSKISNLDHITNSYQDDSHLQPLHILDLPLLQLKPNAEALLTVLKLLSLNQVYNFSTESTITDESETINIDHAFSDRSLDELTVSKGLAWLSVYCPRFDTREKLAYIPNLSEPLRKSYESEYNSYLTRIISNELDWISDEEVKAQIFKETSLRISENCGRTAQPEIIRKIAIPNLANYLNNGAKHIKLKEPSLTNDNLGLKTWGSSLILANRLINKNTNNYIKDNVLELGSGTGLVGLVSCILGHSTILTDLSEITPNLQENVNINEVTNCEVHELNWCDPSSFTEKYGNIYFNTILASDPIYSSQHPYWLIDMIDKFLSHNEDSRVLIQIPLRPKFEDERATLWGLFKQHSFIEEECELEDGFDDFGEMKFCFKMYKRDGKNCK